VPKIKTPDGVNLYYEEAGTGTPVDFVHEFAGDYRTWKRQWMCHTIPMTRLNLHGLFPATAMLKRKMWRRRLYESRSF
jgi:pimeloyl-ACP methyl ester carboxylesterase